MPEPRVSESLPPRPDVAGDEGTGATSFTIWRRLHPAAIAVWISGIIGGFAIPLLVLVVLGGERGPLFFSVVFGGIAVIGSAIRWTRFFYRLNGRTLVIRGGLLQRWERTIQPARIQSVDVVQKLTHRLFGVVELRIEVVGGHGAEGSLVALTPEEAKQLRALLMAEHVADDDPTEPALVRLRAADLLLAGVTGGRVAVVAAMAGWAFQVLPEGTFVETLNRLAGARRSDFETILVIIGVVLTASILISLVSTILVYWDFSAVRRGDRLIITRGLLQTRRSVVPIARIQAIRLEENLVRRAFGLASLRVLTAGYGRGSGDEQQSSMLVPVADRTRCLELLEAVLGSADLRNAQILPAPSRALVRRLSLGAVVGVGVVALVWAVRDGAFAALPVLPLALGFEFLAWRALGHAVVGPHVLARSGALVRRTTVANQANIQHLVLRRSPTQRPFGIASLTLAIPKAATAVIDVDRDLAEERFADLASRLVG